MRKYWGNGKENGSYYSTQGYIGFRDQGVGLRAPGFLEGRAASSSGSGFLG